MVERGMVVAGRKAGVTRARLFGKLWRSPKGSAPIRNLIRKRPALFLVIGDPIVLRNALVWPPRCREVAEEADVEEGEEVLEAGAGSAQTIYLRWASLSQTFSRCLEKRRLYIRYVARAHVEGILPNCSSTDL